ncbi:MAG: hypothetical protein ACYC3B_03605 [Sedimentisphaerales bacterium]
MARKTLIIGVDGHRQPLIFDKIRGFQLPFNMYNARTGIYSGSI